MQAIPMGMKTDMKIDSEDRRPGVHAGLSYVLLTYARERVDVPVARPVDTQVTCAANTNLEHMYVAAAGGLWNFG